MAPIAAMPKEKPPRRRLIAPDSDDEASAETGAEATKEPEEGEDPEAEEELLEGEVDFKSIAARLGTTIAVPDDDTPVAPDAFAPILEALAELKTADLHANPRLAEKATKAKVLDALFALLEDAPKAIPPPKPPKTAALAYADAEGTEGGTGDADPPTSEEPPEEPTEDERRAALFEAHRRAKYDALALPATRALAHMCSSHASFRKTVGCEVMRVGTVFAALQPGRLAPKPADADDAAETAQTTDDAPFKVTARPPQTPEDCLREASLRVLASVASASTTAAAQVARLAAGRAEALPSALPEGQIKPPEASKRWFDACLRSADDRVVAKASRLTAVLTRTKRNRDVLFSFSSRVLAPKTKDDDVLCVRRDQASVASDSNDREEEEEEEMTNDVDLLASVFQTFKTSSNASARRACAKTLESACADVGDATVRSAYLDLEGPGFEVADALARCFLFDPDPDARVAAGHALLGVTDRHRETACCLGDRDLARALFQVFPPVSEEWPKLVVPPPDTENDAPPGDAEGEEKSLNEDGGEDESAEEKEKNAEGAKDDVSTKDDDDDDDESRVSASPSSVVTVSGHNLFTDHFGVRPVGYASPPPKARPVRGFPGNDADDDAIDDAYFYTENEDADEEDCHTPPIVVAEGPHACVFPVALRLYASVLDAHAPSRKAEAGACFFPVAYLEKVGDLLVKPPNELTEADLRTPLTYLLTLLRDAAPFVPPEPPPVVEPPPPTEEELAAAEAAEAAEAAKRERRRERRRADGEDTDSDDDDDDDDKETETEEAKLLRLDLERRTRVGERRRHEEDAQKHNAKTRAGALAVFRALAVEPSFRDALRCARVYPTAAERLVAAIPASFDSVEEAARFLVALADGPAEGPPKDSLGFEASEDAFLFEEEASKKRGEDVANVVGDDGDFFDDENDAPLDVSSSLNQKGLVRVLKRVAKTLLSPSSVKDRPTLCADDGDVDEKSATMAHETALLAFSKLRLFQPRKKPMRFSSFYRTTPPKPPAPQETWRAKTTRNVDDVLEDGETHLTTFLDEESNDPAMTGERDLDAKNSLRATFRAAYSTLEKKETAVKILPRHVALPELWRFADETHPAFPEGAPPLGLVALKERMRRCVEGAEDAEEDARHSLEVKEAEEDEQKARVAVERAEDDSRRALFEQNEAYAELEAAEAAARRLDDEDAIAARFAGVARATTRDERHAMTKTFENVQGERLAAKKRTEHARAEVASKTLAASVMHAVLRKERLRLAEAETSVASLRDAPVVEPRGPWTLEDFDVAVTRFATTDVDPRVGPPPCLFAGLKFIVALLGGVEIAKDAFATPPYAPPNETDAETDETRRDVTDETEKNRNVSVGDAADVSASAGAPPSREARDRHRIKHDTVLWNDPNGVLRTALAASGDDSLASRMRRFVDDALWDFDPNDMDAAKALFLTRCYVKDAEAESALAGRLVKWAYSACRHCDVLREKARRKEAKRRDAEAK